MIIGLLCWNFAWYCSRVLQGVNRSCVKVYFQYFLVDPDVAWNQKEVTDVFFATTKLFQSNDIGLRRMVYLIIKEISPSNDEVVRSPYFMFCFMLVTCFISCSNWREWRWCCRRPWRLLYTSWEQRTCTSLLTLAQKPIMFQFLYEIYTFHTYYLTFEHSFSDEDL